MGHLHLCIILIHLHTVVLHAEGDIDIRYMQETTLPQVVLDRDAINRQVVNIRTQTCLFK